ncbi:MAG: TIGR02444 family protein [Hyphomicrobiales bacterium]
MMSGSPTTGPQPRSDVPSPFPLDTELWRFALSFYGREGVAPACLALQERLAVDVNVLLFGIFALLKQGIALEAEDLDAVGALVHDWQAEIVKGLRHIRTRLKSGPSPAACAATEELRNSVKSVEIAAERIELAMLAGWLERRPLRQGPADADPGTVLALIARHFASGATARLGDPAVRQALRTLTHAAGEAASEEQSPARS